MNEAINSEFFTRNRNRLAELLPQTLLVITAQSAVQFSADIPYPFRQDSNFWYLCGINEPDLILVINTSDGQSTLLLPKQNNYQMEWDGENQTGVLTQVSGITLFGDIEDLPTLLKNAKKKQLTIGYLAPLDEVVQPYGFYANPARRRIEAVIKSIEANPVDIRADIGRLRQIKHKAEIVAIQSAIDATGAALADIKASLSNFKTEQDIERALSAAFYIHRSDGHAFEPIIASGKNAATIHYKKNNAQITENSLLLLDVGVQSEGYAADISRVWAVGKASVRQKEIFDTVFDIQSKALSILKPGITIREFQDRVERYSFKKQENIGVKQDSYPHGVSHFLGFDVHDAGDYSMPLSEGMVITVEPGIYLPDEGIGVRLEDDILVTNNGIKVMSDKIPRIL